MIHIKSKAKRSARSKGKLIRKNAPSKPCQPASDLTAEDIAEINMFGAAIAKANWEASKERWNRIVADYTKAKTKAKRRP